MVGYHASHEQFTPSDLLHWSVMAEQAGFSAINSSDHFHPWSERQGQSGFSFAWLGAVMQATKLPCGVVCSPGQRYHPAIVAQAAATLAQMYPGRFWMSLGSGEALNENITGDKWPMKEERNNRLRECEDIIKRLFNGETVTYHGSVTIQEARLYTLPEKKPLLLGAALSVPTAEWIGSWMDGITTIYRPESQLRPIVEAFHKGGGKGKPMYLQMQLSYARNYDDALQGAFDQWRTNLLPSEILDDLWQVKQFDAAAQYVRLDDIKEKLIVSSRTEDFIGPIKSCIDMGFERIILHNANREQEAFIADFGEYVLPHFKQQ